MASQDGSQTANGARVATAISWRAVFRLLTAPVKFVARSAMEFVEINGLYLAAAIAYYSFMSIFPLALVLLWVSRQWIGIEEFDARLIAGIEAVVPVLGTAEGSSFIEDFIQRAVSANAALTLASLAGLLLGALGIFGAIRKSMNEIWGVEQYRPLLIQRVWDVCMMIAGSCVLFLSLMLAIVFTFLEQIMTLLFPEVAHLSPVLIAAIRWSVPLAITWAAITVIYSWLPNVEVGLSEVVWVAGATTIAFELVKAGFIFYLQQETQSIVSIYGSLSTIMFFLYFVYAQSIVLLMGAMFAAKRTHRRRCKDSISGRECDMHSQHGDIEPDGSVSVSLSIPRYIRNATA